MATKQDVFTEAYHHDFAAIQTAVLLKLGTMEGLTDAQKLGFIELFAQRRNEFGRNAVGFIESFTEAQQDRLYAVLDGVLADVEAQLSARVAEIQARRALLAS